MDIVSFNFIIFFGLLLMVYYLIPEKYKQYFLIAESFIFVATYDYRGIFWMIILSALIWYGAIAIDKTREDSLKTKGKQILIVSITISLSMLLLIKYILPWSIKDNSNIAIRLFVPIGISYYTLQAISYITDVYWKKIHAERSFTKVLLYLCYFPQVLQGPINRYQDFTKEMYEKVHHFDLHNIKYGVQLMLWGFFKILVVGGRSQVFVQYAFHMENTAYGWATVLGLIMFGFELYGNFSGGIDVIRGVSECLGIELKDNFNQPFFSKSLGEFWRRWHISLGTWMKDYIFFPISMSKCFTNAKKKLKKKIDKKPANRIMIALADIIVFLIVGFWHGLGTNYVLWGLYNGLILAFSEIMTVRYMKAKSKLKIQDNNSIWKVFCILRTFIIITLGWATDCSTTASGSFQIISNMLQFSQTNMSIFNITMFALVRAAIAIFILIFVDIIHEKGISIRKWMDSKNIFVQMIFWTIVIQMIACLRADTGTGGLMYAGF